MQLDEWEAGIPEEEVVETIKIWGKYYERIFDNDGTKFLSLSLLLVFFMVEISFFSVLFLIYISFLLIFSA